MSQIEPVKVKLEGVKTYNYCNCGKSTSFSFCNGAHIGTEFLPL